MSNKLDVISVLRKGSGGEIAVLSLCYLSETARLSAALRSSLYKELKLLSADASCRVIVLKSDASNFCAGDDLAELAARGRLDSPVGEYSEVAWELFELLSAGPKPLVVMLSGQVSGVGLAIAMACDVVVAVEDAVLSAPWIHQGLFPDVGVLRSLYHRAGGRAKDLVLTGRSVSSEEALNIGLIDQVVQPSDLESVALSEAQKFLKIPPLALASLRKSMAHTADSLEAVIDAERAIQPFLRESQDHAEAITAFKEKRSPVFMGA